MLFDKIRKMSNVLIKKIDKIEVEPNKCLKVRAVTSSCSACMDVCPTNSIEFKLDSIEIKQPCLNCGLCTTVCLTNALKWNAPPLIQLYNQIIRLSENDNPVYISCSSVVNENPKANLIEVPCLGMLPTEFWISVGLNASNVRIIHQSKLCHNCKVTTGEAIFMKQRKEAEYYLNKKFDVSSSFKEESTKDREIIDYNRRRFITSLLEEVKETNTISVKEVLEVEKTLTPFEKFDDYFQQQNEVEEIIEEVNEIKYTVMDQLLNDAVIHTDKNALLFNEFKKNPDIQEKMTFLIPEIKDNCTHCGACAFLCPTNAIVMDNDCIILSTTKCVSCQLCVEICYEKHIHMIPKNGAIFNEKFIYLLKK